MSTPNDPNDPQLTVARNTSSTNSAFRSGLIPPGSETSYGLNETHNPFAADEQRYDIKSVVGSGGMGIIQAVEDTHLKRVLAMKVLSDQFVSDKSIRHSFLREAQLTAQLQHPNIIPVHDLGSLPGSKTPYYVMKLIEGESLLEIIEKIREGKEGYAKKYTPFQLLNIFRKVCEAMAYAHSRGIIHRDIKPANIMVGAYGEVLLLDWGLAKEADEKEDENGNSLDTSLDMMMTQDGIIKGSLAYLSPEQSLGDINNIDRLTDIFLLGATLYHMLTLQPPYLTSDIQQLIMDAEECDYPHPQDTPRGADIPNFLSEICVIAMAHQRKDRFQSVDELITRLDDYISGNSATGFLQLDKGDFLIHAKDKNDDAYILASGKLEISREIDGRKVILDYAERGAIIGELASLTRTERNADVRAVEPSEVIVISGQNVQDELNKMPPWLEKIVLHMAERLSCSNERLHPFMAKGAHIAPASKQLYYIFCTGQLEHPNETYAIDSIILAQTAAENLAITPTLVTSLIDIFLHHNILKIADEGRICCPEPENLKHFHSYIQSETLARKGVKSLSEVPVSKIRNFDKIFSDLNKL